MKLATWNVNSLNARLPRVLEFLGQHAPELLFLQETKCEPDAFPHLELAGAGYHAIHHPACRWSGVAIGARRELPLEDTGRRLGDEARWVEANAGGLRVATAYVPNGRALDSPEFPKKLAFLEAMRDRARDYVLLGARVAPRLRSCGIDRNYRKGKPTPSDHAPLLAELAG